MELALDDMRHELEAKFGRPEQDKLWKDSPFAWMRRLSPRTKGAVGEDIVRRFCVHAGVPVSKSRLADYDLLVDGLRIEVKLSLLWDSGIFRFQQIRPHYQYDLLVCLGIAPEFYSMWVIPKACVGEVSKKQHGREDTTHWVSVDPGQGDTWWGSWYTEDLVKTILEYKP